MIAKAIAVMIGITIANHLGLTEAISKVLTKILECSMCGTFWASLALLILTGENPIKAAIVSILAAYFSNWFTFLLVVLQNKYNIIWRRLKKK